MNSNYNVPIIPQNLSKHETIIQIAEVINHLSSITEGVFTQVTKRLESNTGKLNDLSQRVDIINEKINKLKGAKKATQVFSSSRYPASDIYREYKSIFSDAAPVELKRHKVKPKNISPTYEPLDKLQFYHVSVSSNDKEEKIEGLGEIPGHVNCVNDLLLYNSGKNLYKNFVITDPLRGPQNIREEDDVDISEIGAAPHSISERSTTTRSVTQNYFYTPQIGEVPALDVPLDLPDLPGIADDLHYENEIEPGIAPSAIVTQNVIDNIVDLPAIDQTDTDIKEIENESLPQPPIAELPKLPPLAESKDPQEPRNSQVQFEPVTEKFQDELPKPPEIKVKLPKDIPPENDARSSLMEAIRNAGGSRKAKLKSTQVAPKEKTTKNPGGDLMADLHSKLFLRRKGISGTKKQVQENSVDPDSTLGKISAMIPPPEPKNDVESASNDEDWD